MADPASFDREVGRGRVTGGFRAGRAGLVATSGLALKGDAWAVRELAYRLPSLVPLPRLGPGLFVSKRPTMLGPDLRMVAL